MWLYRHHTSSDLIDLDPATLTWRAVDDSEKPGDARVLADLPVRGSYTVEDGRYYFKYWTDDETCIFAADDGSIFPLCRHRPDNSIQMLMPGARLTIDPVPEGEPGYTPGQALVRLEDGTGQLRYTLRYNAAWYHRAYNSDITAAAMFETLSNWDFFVALQGGLEIFNNDATKGIRRMTLNDHKQVNLDGEWRDFDTLLRASTDEPCPRAGAWASTEDLNVRTDLVEGEPLPKLRGQHTSWVWINAN